MNSSQPSHFTLGGYFDVGLLKYLCFVLLLCLYLLIIGANLLLILVICVNRTLHEPMYLFLLSLFVNELYGSSSLFPLLLVQVLSDSHTVSAPLCLLQIFVIYSYGGVEFFTLGIMSYDRYLAICCPLQYHRRLWSGKAVRLAALCWFIFFITVSVLVAFLSSLQLCGSVVSKVYCDYHSVVKLSCQDSLPGNMYGLLFFSVSVSCPLCLIIFTYSRIFRVCFSGSEQSRQKAVATCTPHLASLLNFTCGATFEVLQSRFNMNSLPSTLRIFLSLYFLTCPPIFNPVMYGLKLSKIRLSCRNLLSHPSWRGSA
ncbi:olfactory receptor 10A6-like [Salarias fasciatus]|uniref:olfactory receptor 10A6-like n=1 Tax=Salarias fasciatus TaxID=181472 RepID=UPI001176F1EC|nr:olfactory receptor 10A6-like [Salarias fasciatus]